MTPFPERAALQPERTALAWHRTALVSVLLLVPMILVSVRMQEPALAAGGACAALASSVIVSSVRRRLRQLGDDSRGYSPFVPMVQVALVTLLGALGGAAVGVALFVA